MMGFLKKQGQKGVKGNIALFYLAVFFQMGTFAPHRTAQVPQE